MLAVIEDLLDSWPGTLIAVSHDRVLPRGGSPTSSTRYSAAGSGTCTAAIDEYLRLRFNWPLRHRHSRAAGAPRGPPAGGRARRRRVRAGNPRRKRAGPKKELDRLDRQNRPHRGSVRRSFTWKLAAQPRPTYERLTELGAPGSRPWRRRRPTLRSAG